MKKYVAALLYIFCLAPALAFAVPTTTHFDSTAKYGVHVVPPGLVPPPCAPPGKALFFDGTNYSCTDVIDNTCPDGWVRKHIDPVTNAGSADDATGCEQLHPVTKCTDVNPAYIQTGVDDHGNVQCGFPPKPSCRIAHGQNPHILQFFNSFADCDDDEFLMTGGAASAVPMGPEFAVYGHRANWCWTISGGGANGGNGYGFIHHSNRVLDPNNNKQAWRATSYADVDSLGNHPSPPGKPDNCSHAYAVCCKYPNGISPGDLGNATQPFQLPLQWFWNSDGSAGISGNIPVN